LFILWENKQTRREDSEKDNKRERWRNQLTDKQQEERTKKKKEKNVCVVSTFLSSLFRPIS
jgi:hypothetical protein